MDRKPLRLDVNLDGPEWVAEVVAVSGSQVRAPTREAAIASSMARALRALASALERQERGWELADCPFDVHDT